MTKHLPRILLLSIAGLIAASPLAHAGGEADFDLEAKYRAKVAKEKAKQASKQNDKGAKSSGAEGECGSQNIGNIEASGIGRGPREVFIFAPNTINLVSGNGCK